MKSNDINRLVELLANSAVGAPAKVGPEGYYMDLVRRSVLPDAWIKERTGGWTGNANYDARELIGWALAKGVNPADPKCTTLGTILLTMLRSQDVGLDGASTIVALIEVYQLCSDAELRTSLRVGYGIPELASVRPERAIEEGPDIDWRGPTDVVELQSWIKPEPPLLDVGFLARAIQSAASVCRVELSRTGSKLQKECDPRGTGVLVRANLVLTNHHVMAPNEEEKVDANARDTVVCFGLFSAEGGEDSEGQRFKLAAEHPIVKLNQKLDYALLRVEEEIRTAKGVKAASIAPQPPPKGIGLNILQHPYGASMKIAISSNGVTAVNEEDGKVQYVTTAEKGSSGSPCFDDDWKMIALHHSMRSRSFGRIGEGILMASIVEEIRPFLA